MKISFIDVRDIPQKGSKFSFLKTLKIPNGKVAALRYDNADVRYRDIRNIRSYIKRHGLNYKIQSWNKAESLYILIKVL